MSDARCSHCGAKADVIKANSPVPGSIVMTVACTDPKCGYARKQTVKGTL